MKPTQTLHELGQSLWLDNISRQLLDDGTLADYIRRLSVTGLTSNPSIFQKAVTEGDAYDRDIAAANGGQDTEALFMALALDDLRRAVCARTQRKPRQRRLGFNGSLTAFGQRHRRQH